ncbi:DUF1292 domain-containing protein [Weissella kandleri]|uniref:DUF1292 domain-containing protein n=1 Tax=Weissella kandleri TaxID=1616 RepID=UPI00387E499B
MDQNHDNLSFTFIDEAGEYQFKELFRFEENEKFKRTYIILYNDDEVSDDEDYEIQAFVYAPQADRLQPEDTLLPIETDEEWDMVTEMINTYFDDPQLNGNL